jgi:hypothetical protein
MHVGLGIGLGIGIPVVMLLALILLLAFRRRDSRSAKSALTNAHKEMQEYGPQQNLYGAAYPTIQELNNDTRRTPELSAREYIAELSATR